GPFAISEGQTQITDPYVSPRDGLFEIPAYSPNSLLNRLFVKIQVKVSALARLLTVTPISASLSSRSLLHFVSSFLVLQLTDSRIHIAPVPVSSGKTISSIVRWPPARSVARFLKVMLPVPPAVVMSKSVDVSSPVPWKPNVPSGSPVANALVIMIVPLPHAPAQVSATTAPAAFADFIESNMSLCITWLIRFSSALQDRMGGSGSGGPSGTSEGDPSSRHVPPAAII